MNERWELIPGNIKFQVSSKGQIRNAQTKRILVQHTTPGNYKTITLLKATYLIHRLVAMAFIPNPENKKTVDHINRIRDDNNVANLQWATHAEQSLNRAPFDIGNSRGIVQLDVQSRIEIAYFPTLQAAALQLLGSKENISNLSSAALGKSKSAYGFAWRYADINEDLPDEEWREFEKKGTRTYFVSNLGRVRCNDRLLKQTIDNSGYLTAHGQKRVHVLVARQFIDNPEGLPVVNHIDGDKTNPHVANLEWMTAAQNAQHAADTGLKSNVKKVAHVDADLNIIQVYNSCTDAGRSLKVNIRSINKCCRGELKTCGPSQLHFRYYDMDKKCVVATKQKTQICSKEKRQIREVLCFGEDDKLLYTYKNVTEACKALSINSKTVAAHCKGQVQHPTGKYRFRYSD